MARGGVFIGVVGVNKQEVVFALKKAFPSRDLLRVFAETRASVNTDTEVLQSDAWEGLADLFWRRGQLQNLVDFALQELPENPQLLAIVRGGDRSLSNERSLSVDSGGPKEIEDFGRYCKLCIDMLDRASTAVYTVQTAAQIEAGDFNENFRKYMAKTGEKIVLPHNDHDRGLSQYYRLVVVDELTLKEERVKLEAFFEAIEQALDKFRGRDLNLDCLHVCLIHREVFTHRYFSNVDTHLTDSEVAIALQTLSDESSLRRWHACLYVPIARSKLISAFREAIRHSKKHPFLEFRPAECHTLAERLSRYRGEVMKSMDAVAMPVGRQFHGGDTISPYQRAVRETSAYKNSFFRDAHPVEPNRLSPLVQWYLITRAFALNCPKYVAIVAKMCAREKALGRRRKLEDTMQILCGIAAGEFGVGMPINQGIHFRLFRDTLLKATVGRLDFDNASPWPETEMIVRYFERGFGALHSGAAVLCVIEETAFLIVAAMSKIFPNSHSPYIDIHLDIERKHSEDACRIATVLVNSGDSKEVKNAIGELGVYLGAFWERIAKEMSL
jgi:hypothetical protein